MAPNLSHTNKIEIDLQKSVPTQIRQLFLDFSNSIGHVGEFAGDLISARRLEKQCKTSVCEK